MLAIYLGLTYLAGEYGRMALYPIRLLVTFLHEAGHAAGAIITGGNVRNLAVNADGSGYTITAGGSRTVILMGGYLGSAIFGNLLFYLGARSSTTAQRQQRRAEITLYVLAAAMLIASVFWFTTLFTTGLLVAFALTLIVLARKTAWDAPVLMFIGLASILHIIQDFNIGPRSDLNSYAEHLVILPATAWMYLWLALAILMFAFNLRLLWQTHQKTRR